MSNFALQGERNQFDLRTRYGVISDSVFLLSNPEGRQAQTLVNNLYGSDSVVDYTGGYNGVRSIPRKLI